MAQSADDLFYLVETFLFCSELIICDAGQLCMGNGAAQCFCIDVFADGGFYQVGACQEDRTIAFHHQCFITHDR